MDYPGKDDGFNTTRDQYARGYFLLSFDSTPTLCNGTYADPVPIVNDDIELKFALELLETISVIVYCQYSNKIVTNQVCKVTTDF